MKEKQLKTRHGDYQTWPTQWISLVNPQQQMSVPFMRLILQIKLSSTSLAGVIGNPQPSHRYVERS